MLEKLLESLDLGAVSINVMIGNILGMRIVYRIIYLGIFIVRNIQLFLIKPIVNILRKGETTGGEHLKHIFSPA